MGSEKQTQLLLLMWHLVSSRLESPWLKKQVEKSGMMAQVFYPSSWEAKAGGPLGDTSFVHTVSSRIVGAGPSGRGSETLFQRTPKSKNKNNPPFPPKENTVKDTTGCPLAGVLHTEYVFETWRRLSLGRQTGRLKRSSNCHF